MTRKNLNIREETYNHLDENRSEGQSFDGKIRELLKQAGELPAEATA